MSITAGSPDAEAIADLQAAFTEWNSGQQEQAIARIRNRADAGSDWANPLIAWMYMQQANMPVGPGMPSPTFAKAIPYVIRAVESGMPWAAANLFNSAISSIQNSPDLFEPVMSLLEKSQWGWAGVDIVGNAWNMLASGHPELAFRLLNTHFDFPRQPADVAAVLAQAREQVTELRSVVNSARELGSEVNRVGQASRRAIEKAQSDLQTKADQAGLMINTTTTQALNKNFTEDATQAKKESKFAWRVGIGVLVAAATFAVGPLIAYYFDLRGTPEFNGPGLLAAHAGSTAALGTVAGVLLARSRNRDAAQRRATDLATAISTTIAIGNQIKDEGDKERFQLAMLQLVLQTHVQVPPAAKSDEVAPNIASLVSAMRPATSPQAPGPTT